MKLPPDISWELAQAQLRPLGPRAPFPGLGLADSAKAGTEVRSRSPSAAPPGICPSSGYRPLSSQHRLFRPFRRPAYVSWRRPAPPLPTNFILRAGGVAARPRRPGWGRAGRAAWLSGGAPPGPPRAPPARGQGPVEGARRPAGSPRPSLVGLGSPSSSPTLLRFLAVIFLIGQSCGV